MTRPSILCLPALTACVLFSACGGVSETGFFGPVIGTGGTIGSVQAGAPSNAGSTPSASAGSPGNAGGASNLGGSSSTGQGANAGGQALGGASSGGTSGSNSSGAAGTADAGSSGSAGISGSAGSNGGSTSAGSGGTSSVLTCSELIMQGTRQLEAARVCNPVADALQCTGKVTNRCNCQIPVQRLDSPETKAYLDTLKQLDAKNCMPTCTATCAPLMNATCNPSSSSAGPGPTGTCIASYNASGL